MNWHFSFFLLTTVILPFECSEMKFEEIEQLASNAGIKVFNQILKMKPQENIVVSPHGISSMLGMLQMGAEGSSKKQLTSMMKFSANGAGEAVKRVNKAIMAKDSKDFVTMANAMFVKNGFKVEENFAEKNKEMFRCQVHKLDFKDPVSSCKSINTWVKNETNGLIGKLLSPELLKNPLIRMVLVNAMYFKGLWKSQFNAENTKKRAFMTADGSSQQVPMLSQVSTFRTGSATTTSKTKYKFIELPYHGDALSMLVAVPTDNSTQLSSISSHIDSKTISSWDSMMKSKKMQVVMPKFSATAQTDLKEPLKQLGITDIFDPSKSNFAKISKSESLHVSKLLQKAKIEVTEEGTTAAGTTTAGLTARSSPAMFLVDKPFLFYIRHNPSGGIIFMGQINKPA